MNPRRRILTTLLVAAAAATATAQLSLNGIPALNDGDSGRMLAAVRQDAFGKPYTATVTVDPDSAWTDLRIDSQDCNTPILLDPLDGTTPHLVTARRADGTTVADTLTFTFLPILAIHSELSMDYRPARFMLIDPDSARADTFVGRNKWRGSSTLADDRHKRNFHFKITDDDGVKVDRKLCGLRNDNSWILDAGQIDLSRIRNLVANELWLDFAEPPYYGDKEPKARTAMRGKLIELFVNGRYEGVYTLFEPIDRKQLNLKKFDEQTGTFHGMLWKGMRYDKVTTFSESPAYDNGSNTWGGFDLKYPDEVLPTDWSTIYGAVRLAAIIGDTRFKTIAGQYYDLNAMRDYALLTTVLLCIDNSSKNMFWACYDQAEDIRITPIIWDADCSVGQNWTNDPFRDQTIVGPEVKFKIYNTAFSRVRLHVDGFADGLTQCYRALRQTKFHTDSLIARYHSHIDRIIACGAARREDARWGGDSDVGGHRLDFEAEKAYIADWLTRRLDYLDNNDFADSPVENTVADRLTPAVVSRDGRTYVNTDAGVYDIGGRRYPPGATLPPGCYITPQGKILVR